MAADVEAEVKAAALAASRTPKPASIYDSKRPLSISSSHEAVSYRGSNDVSRFTMLEAIRGVLRSHMKTDPRVTLYGEDIEDPKGDVFGVTRGLSTSFPGRVRNAPLSESTIVGVSVGMALAGDRPVAFIQFADFLPLAFNQIASELGSMHWRTNGNWQSPVIIMAACGGYRPGLGPFHAQTLESVMAHVPGVDVLMPSDAADAAGLLNEAFRSERPTIFLYPKSCLNDPDRSTSSDVEAQRCPLGKARLIKRGDDLTLVSWGSTVPICERIASALEGAGLGVDLIDLRSISPWDREAVIDSACRTKSLLVVHEDNVTCGFGAEVIATVVESAGTPVTCRRVARADTFIPCNYSNQLEVLPSFRRVLTAAAEMLDLDLAWDEITTVRRDEFIVNATGSSPADQSVTILSWKVAPGDVVRGGSAIAELESDKAVYEGTAPTSGRVEAILVPEGSTVRIGTPILRLKTDATTAIDQRESQTDSVVRISRRGKKGPATDRTPVANNGERTRPVGVSAPYCVQGRDRLTNRGLLKAFPDRSDLSEDYILRRTGIESRPRLGTGETALTLAVDAARGALRQEGLSVHDIDLIVCSTTTPLSPSPSTACLILGELCRNDGQREIPAFDISAACTGYLYALAIGHDFLQTHDGSRVLVVTSEAMSQIVDPTDFDTSILFGDAATATVLQSSGLNGSCWARLRRPLISASGDGVDALRVVTSGRSRVEMDGKRVFTEASRRMAAMLDRACRGAGMAVSGLDLVIPHQANGRIIEAIQSRLSRSKTIIVNNIKYCGNTSSCTIPIALAEVAAAGGTFAKIGLTAFGSGFTFGAAILERDLAGAPSS